MSIKLIRIETTYNLYNFYEWEGPRPCLVPQKFCKTFHIPRHIESLDVCMKY